MGQFFADNPWVTVFAVIALGALLGLVRFGPVRLGAAGVRVLLTNPAWPGARSGAAQDGPAA
ncbi:hypothetical protein [Streptomyces sp. NPDC007346]|uniref:hypothetical protein n=1 Tax=Streptomyces sp. NPDC007346 TaxID=3154682 RepID=UPI003451591F